MSDKIGDVEQELARDEKDLETAIRERDDLQRDVTKMQPELKTLENKLNAAQARVETIERKIASDRTRMGHIAEDHK